MFQGNVTHPDITKVAGMAGAHGNSSVGKIELVLELDTVAPHAYPQLFHYGCWGYSKWGGIGLQSSFY